MATKATTRKTGKAKRIRDLRPRKDKSSNVRGGIFKTTDDKHEPGGENIK